MAGRSPEAFPELEEIKTFDIIYTAGGKEVSSIGVGLILKDDSPANRSSAARGCGACAFHADSYGAGGEVGPLRAACSGFDEDGIIAALGIVHKKGNTFPTRLGLVSLTVSYSPPCGVDVPGIVRTVLAKPTEGT